MARTCAQHGTEKDSQEGLKMESSRQKEAGKAKNDPEKIFEEDLKKMELTWGTAESEAKIEFHGEKGMAGLSLMDRSNKKKKQKSVCFMCLYICLCVCQCVRNTNYITGRFYHDDTNIVMSLLCKIHPHLGNMQKFPFLKMDHLPTYLNI